MSSSVSKWNWWPTADTSCATLVFGLQQILRSATACLVMTEWEHFNSSPREFINSLDVDFSHLLYLRWAGSTSSEDVWRNIRWILRHSYSLLARLIWCDVSFICCKGFQTSARRTRTRIFKCVLRFQSCIRIINIVFSSSKQLSFETLLCDILLCGEKVLDWKH